MCRQVEQTKKIIALNFIPYLLPPVGHLLHLLLFFNVVSVVVKEPTGLCHPEPNSIFEKRKKKRFFITTQMAMGREDDF